MKLNNIYGGLIFEADVSTIKELVELAVKQKINLSEANLFQANLSHANLSWAHLPHAILTGAHLPHAILTGANLSGVNLSWANLSEANLSRANLTKANLPGAYLCKANLSGVNLSWANLSEANLSQVTGLNDNSKDFLSNFKITRTGIYVFKAIGSTTYDPNSNWVIKPGSYIDEVVNSDRFNLCGCGVNFGTLNYVTKSYSTTESTLWLCRIDIIDMPNIVIPYGTDGKARCSRLKLIKKIAWPSNSNE